MMMTMESPEVEGVDSSLAGSEDACGRVVAPVDVAQHAVKVQDTTCLLYIHQRFGELCREAYDSMRLCRIRHNKGSSITYIIT